MSTALRHGEIVHLDRQHTAVVAGRAPVAELPDFFQQAYGSVFEALAQAGVEPMSPPMAYYPSEPGDVVDVEAGVIVGEEFTARGEVVPSHVPGGRTVVATHEGPYDTLEVTYRSVLEELDDAGLTRREVGVWEEYLTDPDSEPDPNRWRTRLHIPIG
ncbi:MAG: GyrI-like domain-containing protein [Ilumatobacter sp.]|uniref:GyrI-like domain-containing protein n=1 Tax=Ilumatobacter sp. TaxID=1967498 RepID=UPI0026301E1E|nr:GyrI-like domain-containing protein [Ilumatobacter sp.]MDJ0769869.1 GyrI-like domain-containing protein [Ilumatobacter sp.]